VNLKIKVKDKNLTHPNESTPGESRARHKGIDGYRYHHHQTPHGVIQTTLLKYSKSTTKNFDLDVRDHHSQEPT